MTQLEKIKKEISEITNPIERDGYLDGIRVSASLYCRNNYPAKTVVKDGKLEDVTICEMCRFLESNVKSE